MIGMGETWYEVVYTPGQVYKYRVTVQSGIWMSTDGIEWDKGYVYASTGVQKLIPTEVSERLYKYAWQLNDPLSWRKVSRMTVMTMGEGEEEF